MTIRIFENITPQIADSAYIDETALIIGDVIIGADSSIWPMTVLRGDVNKIQVGQRTSIQDGSIVHVTHKGPYSPQGHEIVIGDDVTIGHQVILHGCKIADHCLIGMGSCILDGVEIQSSVIVGAGSLVPPGKILTSGLWLGSPVRKIRELTDIELEQLDYSAKHYVKLKNRHSNSW